MKKLKILNLIIAIYSFIKFSALAYLSNFTNLINKTDNEVIVYSHNIAISHSLIIPKLITNLGFAPWLLVFSLIISVLLALYRRFKDATLLVLNTGSGFFFSWFFKEIFKKSRPPIEYHLVQANGYSFPSGHSLVSFCFYGTLIYLIFRIIKITWLKYTLSALLMILIGLIGLSRIYLGVHYPSDVIGSWFLGTFIIFFWISIYNIKARSHL